MHQHEKQAIALTIYRTVSKLVKSNTALPSLKRKKNKRKQAVEKTNASLVAKEQPIRSNRNLNSASSSSAIIPPAPKQRKRWRAPLNDLPYLELELKEENKNYSTWSLPEIKEQPKAVLGQVSFLPSLSTNYENTAEITNKISYNILWGHNGNDLGRM